VFQNLVCSGIISPGEEYFVDGERYEDKRDAIEAAQAGFGALEFFHVYKAKDHRADDIAKCMEEFGLGPEDVERDV
jgi:hypothetical protein